MNYNYETKGTCSKSINFDIEDGIIRNVKFHGGCDGNLKAISKLVEGRRASEIAELFKGHICGFKRTSCADQLACAIEKAINE